MNKLNSFFVAVGWDGAAVDPIPDCQITCQYHYQREEVANEEVSNEEVIRVPVFVLLRPNFKAEIHIREALV